MLTVKQIDFNEALERTRKGEKVFAVDISKAAPSTKLFRNLTIDEAVKKSNTLIYQIVEKAAK